MGFEITTYFQDLFSSSGQLGCMKFLEGLRGRITDEMNNDLSHSFTTEEVHKVLSQMHPTKAPSLDGMPLAFFQSHWHIIGDSITQFVLTTLHSGDIPYDSNYMFITLVPKKDCPIKVSDFHPISLCNMLYKLISKVIANRLKLILPSTILKSQCAFVPGHQIIDCVLVSYKIIQYLRHKREGPKGFMSLKLNMSKAYD